MPDYDPQGGRRMPDDPDNGSAQVAVDHDELRQGLDGLAQIVAGSQQLDRLLAQVAEYAAQAIPGATGAGVTLLRDVGGPQRIETWGATQDYVREIDRIQYELLDEGPCITCMHERQPVVSGSLGSDKRWPRFGGRVARLGVHSALCLPLVIDDTVIGSINSYAPERDAFTEHAVSVGQRFARPAGVAARNAQLLDAASTKAEQLQAALTSRAVIDQAIGIVLSRTGSTAQEALDRLKQISQRENVKVAVIAERLVEEAVRAARARRASD